MTVFASPNAAVRLAFADGVWREVVVEHEALGVFVEEAFNALFVLGGAKGDGHERLSFAALEDRGAMDARQDVDAAVDRTDLLDSATVEAFAGEDDIAHDARREVIERDFKVFRSEEIGLLGAFDRFDDEFFARFRLDVVARLSARELAFRLLGSA